MENYKIRKTSNIEEFKLFELKADSGNKSWQEIGSFPTKKEAETFLNKQLGIEIPKKSPGYVKSSLSPDEIKAKRYKKKLFKVKKVCNLDGLYYIVSTETNKRISAERLTEDQVIEKLKQLYTELGMEHTGKINVLPKKNPNMVRIPAGTAEARARVELIVRTHQLKVEERKKQKELEKMAKEGDKPVPVQISLSKVEVSEPEIHVNFAPNLKPAYKPLSCIDDYLQYCRY